MSIEECLRDGYSRAGTSGTGLGAIRRAVPGIRCIFGTGKRYGDAGAHRSLGRRPGGRLMGSAGRRCSGEDVSGDAWAIAAGGRYFVLIVADGLGHGIQAAEASAEAISAFRTSNGNHSDALVQKVHRALRGTRGAAVAVASLDRAKRCVRYAGIGNIAGSL